MEQKRKLIIARIFAMLGIILLPIGSFLYKYNVVETQNIPGYATNYWIKYPYLAWGIFVLILGTTFLFSGMIYDITARIKKWLISKNR